MPRSANPYPRDTSYGIMVSNHRGKLRRKLRIMDSTSYRSNRQAAQNQPASEAEADAAPVTESPAPERTTNRTAKSSRRMKNASKPPVKIVVLSIAMVAVLLFLGWWLFTRPSSVGGSIDTNKIQAVFFTNGQVYFGKLRTVNDDYMKLTNIYYLQAKSSSSSKDNPQQTSSGNSSDVQLIKLGDEIHGPEDEMVFNKNQVLFFENLKKDGNVSKTIANYQNNK